MPCLAYGAHVCCSCLSLSVKYGKYQSAGPLGEEAGMHLYSAFEFQVSPWPVATMHCGTKMGRQHFSSVSAEIPRTKMVTGNSVTGTLPWHLDQGVSGNRDYGCPAVPGSPCKFQHSGSPVAPLAKCCLGRVVSRARPWKRIPGVPTQLATMIPAL
jgi:hypothetical protein